MSYTLGPILTIQARAHNHQNKSLNFRGFIRLSALYKSSSSFPTGVEGSCKQYLKSSNKSQLESFYKGFGLHQQRKSDFVSNAANHSISSLGNFHVWYRFIRPYAAVGTVLCILSMSLLAVERLSDFSPIFFLKIFQALVGGMFMQMYVCGFNQICDIELDKVNKPSLPLASGELSMTTAVLVSFLSAIAGLSVAWMSGSPPLFWGFVLWFLVGTAYSANVLPLLRWKRYPLTAALFMLISRAFGVPVAYYMHMKNLTHGVGYALFSRPTIFAVAMLSVFSISTIFFKDIPDIEGDLMHGIKSLASKIGLKPMFWSCIGILEIAYAAAIFVGASSTVTWSKYATILGHLVMAVLLGIRAKSADLNNMVDIQAVYMFLWQLFYAEYLLIALVR